MIRVIRCTAAGARRAACRSRLATAHARRRGARAPRHLCLCPGRPDARVPVRPGVHERLVQRRVLLRARTNPCSLIHPATWAPTSLCETARFLTLLTCGFTQDPANCAGGTPRNCDAGCAALWNPFCAFPFPQAGPRSGIVPRSKLASEQRWRPRPLPAARARARDSLT